MADMQVLVSQKSLSKGVGGLHTVLAFYVKTHLINVHIYIYTPQDHDVATCMDGNSGKYLTETAHL